MMCSQLSRKNDFFIRRLVMAVAETKKKCGMAQKIKSVRIVNQTQDLLLNRGNTFITPYLILLL
jgi:hypothetical protein